MSGKKIDSCTCERCAPPRRVNRALDSLPLDMADVRKLIEELYDRATAQEDDDANRP